LGAQCIFFISKNKLKELNKSFYAVITCTICAVLAGLIARQLFTNVILLLLVSAILFIVLIIATGQINLKDRGKLLRFLKG
jgi:hypothetical protein